MTRLAWGLTAALILPAPWGARADVHLVPPFEIDFGEIEIEHNGDAVFDQRPSRAEETSSTSEFGTGLTPWWHSEIELGFDRAPGGGQPTWPSGDVGPILCKARPRGGAGQSQVGDRHAAWRGRPGSDKALPVVAAKQLPT